MDEHTWPCRIKSVRRKKRLVKTDRDKQLIQLDKRRNELWEQRKKSPPIALEQPYQRGWKRFFVLREDVKCGPHAEFYEALLAKINTTHYHHDKSFKHKKRRKWRYGHVVKKQILHEFDLYHWNNNKAGLSEQEKECFTRVETYSIKTKRLEVKYVITEPWRYVLKIQPHMVTHKKQVSSELEQELAWIDNYISQHYLSPRIHLLTHGKNYRSRDRFAEQSKYINKIKNIPRYSQKEVYLALEL
ncbi:hypothetical protein [Mucilaginibacter agri]|uniref:Uncharacterized protein n=1 Tax=Mucilaginibacter agri TaxID=2695265 RepID=A0A965ZEL4_9SPHI|nr:hypothetical protein [Mucilaginibacter agri]NCD68564.1 hypothetical protein [Mucilaginibacter agri]